MRAQLKGFETSSSHPRPARLIQGNRGIDDRFRPIHQLYWRIVLEDIEGSLLLPARIRYKNASVNWSKYSKPWDVIFDYPKCGIAQCLVADLPWEIPKELPKGATSDPHTFYPKHDPLPDMYPHSEIRLLKGGNPVDGSKTNSLAAKEYRAAMRTRSVIILKPSI